MSADRKYSAVIFDLFGTLVNTFSSSDHDLVLAEMAKVLGVQYDAFAQLFDYDMRYDREVGEYSSIEENIKRACNLLGETPKPADVSKAVKFRYEFMEQSLIPRKDAIRTINQMKVKGYIIGLISDCSPEVPVLWLKTPFANVIDVPIFSCEVGIKKPDPRIYQIMCEKLEAEPNECLYIGDGDSSELEGALDMGMEPVLIRVKGEDDHDRDRPLADKWDGKKVTSISDVLQYI
jgi:putative hydrolase of the HAD superfamily